MKDEDFARLMQSYTEWGSNPLTQLLIKQINKNILANYTSAEDFEQFSSKEDYIWRHSANIQERRTLRDILKLLPAEAMTDEL